MANQQEIVRSVINKHAKKAGGSEYDRGVAISAISASRDVILAVPTNLSTEEFSARLLSDLQELLSRYHDPDGEYTSGKGVIGALIDDLRFALRDLPV